MPIAIRRFSIFLIDLLNRYEKGSKLSGIIYIHRISDNRFGGVAGRNFDMFRKICGDKALSNVVLVTNMWGDLSRDEFGKAYEKELSGGLFKPAIDLGAQTVRHHNTVQSAHQIVRRIAGDYPITLRIQRELVDRGKDIISTTAGEAVNRKLNEQIRKHQAELREVQEGMLQALIEKDEDTGSELEEEARKLQERMEEITRELERMPANYATEKQKVEARMKETGWGAKKWEQKEVNRTRHPQDETDMYVSNRVRSKQQMKRPRDLVGIPGTISTDGLAHHNTSPTRTRRTEWADPRQPQLSPTLLQAPSPHTPSPTISYVQVFSRMITQGL